MSYFLSAFLGWGGDVSDLSFGPVVFGGQGDPVHPNWQGTNLYGAGFILERSLSTWMDALGEADLVGAVPLGRGAPFAIAGTLFGFRVHPFQGAWAPHLAAEAGFSLAYNDNSLGEYRNLQTKFNFAVAFSGGVRTSLSDGVTLLIEVRGVHFSNAGISSDNLGLNAVVGAVGLTYHSQPGSLTRLKED